MTAETEAPKFQIVPFQQIVSLLEQNLATLCQLLPCKKYPREVPQQHHFVPTILDWPTFSQVSGGELPPIFAALSDIVLSTALIRLAGGAW